MTKQEKLIEEIKRLIQEYDRDTNYDEETIDRLARISTIELEPVRHGKWHTIWFGHDYQERIVCSECELMADRMTDYCPNCGAKMEV